MFPKEKFLFGLILLFFATLFFARTSAVNVVLTAGLVIFSCAAYPLKTKLELLKARPYIVAMLHFYLFLTASLLWSENLPAGLQNLRVRLPLLLFPISLGLLPLTRSFRDRVLLAFAWLTAGISFLCLSHSVFLYTQSHRSDIFYNDNLTLLLKQQSIYVAALVNVAIFVFGYFLLFRKGSYRPLMVISGIFLFGFSFLLASRINLAVLAVSSIAGAVIYILQKRKFLEGAVLVLGLLIGSFLISKFFPQTLNRFRELSFTEFNFETRGQESHFNTEVTEDQWNGANFRLAAWTCGWAVFKENPIFGTGIGDKETALQEQYRLRNFQYAIDNNRNVHNNYLDVLFSSGLTGLLLMLAAWVLLPLFRAYQLKDGLAFLIIGTFAMAWITEVYFSRNFGSMAVGFLIPFLPGYKTEHNPAIDQ